MRQLLYSMNRGYWVKDSGLLGLKLHWQRRTPHIRFYISDLSRCVTWSEEKSSGTLHSINEIQICFIKHGIFAFHDDTHTHKNTERYSWNKNIDTFKGIDNVYFLGWLKDKEAERRNAKEVEEEGTKEEKRKWENYF